MLKFDGEAVLSEYDRPHNPRPRLPAFTITWCVVGTVPIHLESPTHGRKLTRC